MSVVLLIACGLLGAGISVLLIPQLLRLAHEKHAFGRAGDIHHTHRRPIPRIGGIALAAAFLMAGLFAMFVLPKDGVSPSLGVILAGGLAMFLLGLMDDLKSIGARKKFLGQILIALGVYCLGLRIEGFKNPLTGATIDFGFWSGMITVLWLVAITNLINLIDGADGLAGGIGLMLMLLLTYVAFSMPSLSLIACAMAGALAGFLYFNFPPAKIYMGDSGAYFLGFLIGMLAIVSSQKGTIAAALIAPLFVLTLPILDTMLAILRRGLRGLPIFRPDRKHIHHKLARSGFSGRKVVLTVYFLTLIFLLMALGIFWSQGRLLPILLGSLGMLLLVCAGTMNFSREWFAIGRVLGNSLEMRKEIQYALISYRWLEAHSLRAESIESLWADYVFLAQKLGFTSVTLTLEDGQRVWRQEDIASAGPPCRSARHELDGGKAGTLEFMMHTRAAETDSAGADEMLKPCCKPAGAGVPDATLFDILSELAAEGWLKAAVKWQKRHDLPIRFASKVGAPIPRHGNGTNRFNLLRIIRTREI